MARSRASDLRTPLLWLAGARAVLSVIALLLAPFLYRDHFVVLVLLRPTKEVFLAAGFLVRHGKIDLLPVLAAAIPLAVGGVWQFYWLGRSYADEIARCDLPGLGGRILPAERINKLQKVLEKRGARLVFLGRLAAFPSTMVAAAAGSSRMQSRRFLPADGLGATASVVALVGAGYVLGAAYKSAGPWVTAAGVAVLCVLAVLLGRYLRRE